MNIRALIPPGIDEITVNGLHQWDYGRVLEIECAEFGTAIMEVHFAYLGAKVAEIRPCAFTNGVGTVTVPDKCLEFSTPITAWIYGIGDDYGKTIKTIILPLIQRAKPIRNQSIPAEIIDVYTELIGEVEEMVDGTIESLKNGGIVIPKAASAETAEHALTADYAEQAGIADSASTADHANSAGALTLKLVTSCQITAGQGTLKVALTANTPHFFVLEFTENDLDYVCSGVIYTQVGATNHRGAIDHSHAIYFENWDTVNSNVRITGYANTNPTDRNGTLKIYTFGKVT